MYVISGGGYGGSPHGDGISNGCSTIGISKTTPIEIMEQLYPVLFEEYSLHEGSGGAGQHRGGFGVNYRIRLRRGDARVSMVMDHGRAGPPGAQGGGAGGVNKVKIIRDGVEYVPEHLSKDQDIEIHAGDVISVSTPGGGGFGERQSASGGGPNARRRARLLQRGGIAAPVRHTGVMPGRRRTGLGSGATRRRDRAQGHEASPSQAAGACGTIGTVMSSLPAAPPPPVPSTTTRRRQRRRSRAPA